MKLQKAVIDTPIGALRLVAHEGVLCAIAFDEERHPIDVWLAARFKSWDMEEGFPPSILQALASYFADDPRAIDALEVDLGGTPFQQSVWAELRRIPCGQTISYGELAARVGNPRAMRAVGLANGRNPVPVVVPCHRVIATNGTLHGYGGGLPRKEWLLRHEGAVWAASRRPSQLGFSMAG